MSQQVADLESVIAEAKKLYDALSPHEQDAFNVHMQAEIVARRSANEERGMIEADNNHDIREWIPTESVRILSDQAALNEIVTAFNRSKNRAAEAADDDQQHVINTTSVAAAIAGGLVTAGVAGLGLSARGTQINNALPTDNELREQAQVYVEKNTNPSLAAAEDPLQLYHEKMGTLQAQRDDEAVTGADVAVGATLMGSAGATLVGAATVMAGNIAARERKRRRKAEEQGNERS